MLLTIRPHCYMHSGPPLAWFVVRRGPYLITIRRHRHKEYDRLGDAFTTLPSEHSRPQPTTPPLTTPRRGGRLTSTQAPWSTGGPEGPPCPCPRERPCARPHPRPRMRARPPRTAQGRDPIMDGLSSWPVPGDGHFLLIVNSTSNGRGRHIPGVPGEGPCLVGDGVTIQWYEHFHSGRRDELVVHNEALCRVVQLLQLHERVPPHICGTFRHCCF